MIQIKALHAEDAIALAKKIQEAVNDGWEVHSNVFETHLALNQLYFAVLMKKNDIQVIIEKKS